MPLTFTDTSFLPRSLTASFDGVSTKGSLKGFKFDPDALAYFARVEGVNGDNQPLEFAVKVAINDFVVGCKADGIWNAIKSSCIMAGARTLSGALQPLVGPAPTNFNFVSGDYNRKTGLVGNGSTKYLNSNRNNNADPQNDQHLAVYATVTPSGPGARLIGDGTGTTGRSTIGNAAGAEVTVRSRCDTFFFAGTIVVYPCLLAVSRSASSSFVARSNQTNNTVAVTSQTPSTGSIDVFRATVDPTNARIAFYSIGEDLDLAALDTRVTNLMTALDGAI